MKGGGNGENDKMYREGLGEENHVFSDPVSKRKRGTLTGVNEKRLDKASYK